jgi:glycosyltransferase involved in cell wall biosynthesis
MKVLWIGHNLGYPPKGGALQRNYNLLREVSRNCDLHFLGVDQPVTRPDNVTPQDCVAALSQFCASVDWLPLASSRLMGTRYGVALNGLLSGEPYDFTWLRSPEMTRKVADAVKRVSPDVVHFDALGLAQYLYLVGRTPSLLTHHDVESCKISLRAQKTSNPLLKAYFRFEARKLAAAERAWCPRFTVNAVVSEEEGAVLSGVCPGLNIRVVPNGVDTKYFTPRPDPGKSTILFCGSMDMHPNQEAVDYFLKRVWPPLVAQCPDVEFLVVGRKPPEWLQQAGARDRRITITGFVDDIRPYFKKAALCICPVLSGGGTRLKILDSLAMGVPVVATKFAAFGLHLEHGQHLLLAATEEEFAAHIRQVLSDRPLRLRLASAGAERVDQLYSWTVVGRTLLDTYELACRTSGR